MSSAKFNIRHVILITLSAAIGGFLFGFDSSVINGANGALKTHFNATDYELAWSVSLALIGAAVGAYFAGRLADMFGRVRCMLAASALFLVSAIGSGVPFGIPDFIFWRVIGGVGIGVASIIAPAIRHRDRYFRGTAFELFDCSSGRFRQQRALWWLQGMANHVLGRNRPGSPLRHRRLETSRIAALPGTKGPPRRSKGSPLHD